MSSQIVNANNNPFECKLEDYDMIPECSLNDIMGQSHCNSDQSTPQDCFGSLFQVSSDSLKPSFFEQLSLSSPVLAPVEVEAVGFNDVNFLLEGFFPFTNDDRLSSSDEIVSFAELPQQDSSSAEILTPQSVEHSNEASYSTNELSNDAAGNESSTT